MGDAQRLAEAEASLRGLEGERGLVEARVAVFEGIASRQVRDRDQTVVAASRWDTSSGHLLHMPTV